MNPKVDDFLSNANKWQTEFELLRKIVLDCNLTETFKWQNPCYTYNDKNIVLIYGFKNYCGISFFKGAFLKDEDKILLQQTENMQLTRQVRFTDSKSIIKQTNILKNYIYEAIEIEKLGLKLNSKEKFSVKIVAELENKLNEDPKFKAAFEALTPGRKKAYNLYFSAPKQAKTRQTRIEKCTQRIFNGKGLNDCVCGLSKKKSSCDGSHKSIQNIHFKLF